jgi:hypothetical protein
MEQNELELAADVQQDADCASAACEKDAVKRTLWQRMRADWPVYAIWARYALPVVTLLALLVMSAFFNVKNLLRTSAPRINFSPRTSFKRFRQN